MGALPLNHLSSLSFPSPGTQGAQCLFNALRNYHAEPTVLRSLVSALTVALSVKDRDLDVVLFRTIEAIVVAVLLVAMGIALLTPLPFGL